MGFDIQNNQYVDIANKMVVTGVVGGCIAAPLNYLAQKSMIKHSKFWIDRFEKSISKATNAKRIAASKKTIEYLKKGKINWKSLGKTALCTGLLAAGFTCVYTLIKSLFIRDEKISI